MANLAIPFEVYRECEHDDTDVHLSFQVCTYSDSGVIRLPGPVYELRGYKGHSVLVFIWRDSEVFADHDNLNLSGPNLNLSLQAWGFLANAKWGISDTGTDRLDDPF